MKVIVTDSVLDMSQQAAKMIVDQIQAHPQSLLALSTGSTPIGTYQEMVKLYREDKVDFSQAKCLNMDEYVGLDAHNPQGYYYFMNDHLYQHVNFKKENIFGPCTTSDDLYEAASQFDKRIEKEGGIDLILLGIGRDGHIAFNMPEHQLCLNTHIQQLSKTTIQDNARFFNDIEEVPTQAMTIGIYHIFNSKKVIMIANGENKSQIIKDLVQTPFITTRIPATLLKLHPDFTLIIDKEAAQLL